MAIKRVLVPVDFSADSLHALTYACDLARRWGATVVALHVVEPIYLGEASVLLAARPDPAQLLDEQWKICNRELTRLSEDMARDGRKVRTVVKRGVAAHVIVDTAKRMAADLIVMATHGRTGLDHMLVGSVAEKVVRAASCPVLTVRRARARHLKPGKRPARQSS
jgi:nucleotide-binding universal stress UspA family protein